MSDLKYDITEILKLQANRYPMLFIDRVLSCTPGVSSVCLKNFSYNEWYFPTHYDDDPNVPGFVLIESLVQSFLISFLSQAQYKGSRTNFLDVHAASFRKKIVPGDTMIISSELLSFRRGMAKGRSVGKVDDQLACSAEFSVCVPEIMENYRPKQNETK